MFKKQDGFTLIEMMIVLLIISILLFITIPNVVKQSSSIHNKGCEAFQHMVEGQVQSYRMDHQSLPSSVDDLVSGGYLRQGETSCPNGDKIDLGSNGEVIVKRGS
ncbi:MAG: prepilin-type N-terminal cleavage/methylation domain-containing protein [Bacillales bacterium]|nr:prepilin-type N-terminal cleavage/methylation domain-containing protein [Bacillales bacterium]